MKLPLTWWIALVAMVFIYGTYGILMNLSKVDGKIPFNSTSLIFLIETLKFTIALTLYAAEMQGKEWQWPTLRLAAPFAIPAILYSINNNLSVIMQMHMDPATYQVLGNLKIVTTAVLYRFFLKRPLKVQQWISVVLLTTAGVCDSYGSLGQESQTRQLHVHVTVTGLVAMLTYCSISALAGVYTEYILKKDFQTSLHLQNMMLYLFSIFINGGSWFVGEFFSIGAYSSDESTFQFLKGFSIYTWLIVVTQAFNGLAMSAVFKHGNNLVRLFVISCAMVVSTVMSVFVLGITLNALFFVALFLVVLAIYLYYK
nr:hypothetical protein BaRGS_002550 [Batillaria attramentaria]